MFVRYLLIIILFWATDVYAREVDDSIYIAIAAGTSAINGNDYDKSSSGYTRIGVRLPYMSLAVGYASFGEFDYRHTARTHISARGYTLSAAKQFQFDKRIGLNITAGLCIWRTESTFLGNSLGDENGTGTFVGLAPGIRFNPHTTVFLGMERYFDINGLDITTAGVGLVLDF